MFEPNSFTSEPQYQRPDQRIQNIDYIRRLEPIASPGPIAPVPAPVITAPVAPSVGYGYDSAFAQRFFAKLGREYLTCNRLNLYGNSIPLGSFCYAIAFIIYGFFRAKVYKVNDSFLWSIILIFGGIGQCTAGFLEYCRGRTFTTAVYLSFGFYCLSHYAYYTIPEWFYINQNNTMLYNYTDDSICAFYAGWMVIAFGILIASVRTNSLFVCQMLTCLAFFILRTIGEAFSSLGTKRNAAGILQAISGFFSLLVCFSQILNNETFYRNVFPTCPLSPFNGIDIPQIMSPQAPVV